MKYCGPKIRCIISGSLGADLHHVRTRKSGGSDEPCNLMPLAHKFHQECHQIGLVKFSQIYPEVKTWLEENGWEFTGLKWVNARAVRPLGV